LRRKVEAFEPFSDDLASAVVRGQRHLDIEGDPPQETLSSLGGATWEVMGAFVSREPNMAGAYRGRDFPVVWLDQLELLMAGSWAR
jgi:hypothetical protein